MTYSYNNKKGFEKLVCMYSQSVHSWPQDLQLFGWILMTQKKLNCIRNKHGEIKKCLMLSGPVGQRKRLKLFRVIWEQPFPCQKIYLASQRNYEHHFILTLRLWRGVTIVAWVSTSYIGGNSSTNLLAIHIYYHLYPQYIRHHFWRRRCMKRTLVCAFAVTRDKKNYNEKQEYKQHH